MKLGNIRDAHYDPESDTIQGCEPGTFAYMHEHRHQQQFQYELIQLLDQFTHDFALGTAGAATAIGLLLNDLSFGLMLVGLWSLPYFALNWVLEIDATIIPLLKTRSGSNGGEQQ